MEIITEEQTKKATFEEMLEELLYSFDKESLQDIIKFLKRNIKDFRKYSRQMNGTANRINLEINQIIDETRSVHIYIYNCEDITQFKKFDTEMIIKFDKTGTFYFSKISGSAEHGGCTLREVKEFLKIITNFYKSRYKFIKRDM